MVNGKRFMDGRPVGRRTIVMDYVGCARTVPVTPVDGARRASVVMRWVYAVENYPGGRSVRCKQGIGHLEYANCGSMALDVLAGRFRSEEHTSELQSQSNLVCR